MSQLLKALVVLALLCASAALGFLVRSRMPEPQRSKESTEFIELIIVLLDLQLNFHPATVRASAVDAPCGAV